VPVSTDCFFEKCGVDLGFLDASVGLIAVRGRGIGGFLDGKASGLIEILFFFLSEELDEDLLLDNDEDEMELLLELLFKRSFYRFCNFFYYFLSPFDIFKF
jgi:hypothetical protein